MQSDPTTNSLEDQVYHVLKQVDGRIVSSDFDRDWQTVIKRTQRSPENDNYAVKLSRLWKEKFMRPGPALVSVTAVLLIGVSIFLINQEYSGQKTIIAETQTRENIVPLDPSKPIYVPTDDLLQVNVLRYEYQWATFAYYDPITMEIR